MPEKTHLHGSPQHTMTMNHHQSQSDKLTPELNAPAVRGRFSLFDSVRSTEPSGDLSLSELVSRIRNEEWKSKVEEARRIFRTQDRSRYDTFRKKQIPAVTLSAMMKTRGEVESHSGLLQLDFDKKDHPDHTIEEIFQIVKEASFTTVCHLSLSGEGVKGIAVCPPERATHKGSWLAAERYFAEKGLTLDPSTKDISRMCFVSHDPAVYFNESATEIIPVEEVEAEENEELSWSQGTVRPEHARTVLGRLAKKIGPYQDRGIWLHIVGATLDAVGAGEAVELVDEFFPPKEETHERAADVIHTLKPVAWNSLRKHGISTTDTLMEFDDEEIPESEELHSQPLPLVWVESLNDVTEPLDFVEGLLTEGGTSMVYGPSNVGKSFFVMDLAASVATGAPFRGNLAVDPGAVIYVALEGAYGTRNRITALKQSGKLPDDAPFALIFVPLSLLNAADSDRLIATIKGAVGKTGFPVRLVIIDTLARAMPGGNENDGAEMGAIIGAMDRIRHATNANVMLVHHSGKVTALGARGHSSLRAAMDTEIEISRQENATVSTAMVTKQRDLPYGPPMPFSLEQLRIGTSRRGGAITSCVVKHEDESMAPQPASRGRSATCEPDDLLDFLPVASVKEWMVKVKGEFGLGRTQFFDLKKQLQQQGKFRREGPHKIVRTNLVEAFDDEPEEQEISVSGNPAV